MEGIAIESVGETSEVKPVGSDDVGNVGSPDVGKPDVGNAGKEVGSEGREVGSEDVGNAGSDEVGRAGNEAVGNAGVGTLTDGTVAIGMIGGSWRTSMGIFRA